MPHIKFQTSPKSGGNSGSCDQVLNYLEKESKGFFDANRDDLSNDQAKHTIEHSFYKKGVKKTDSKFYSVVFSFSADELKGKTDEQLVEFAKSNFADTYCSSIKGKDQGSDTIAWVAKLEKNRKYKGDHPDVKADKAKSGQLKPGDNRHIHFIVSRKTLDDKQVSPMSNHFKKSNKGAVKSGFDQDAFKLDIENRFDQHFEHLRKTADRVEEKLRPYRPDLVQGNDFDLKGITKRNSERLDKVESQVNEFKKHLKEERAKPAYEAYKKLTTFFKRMFGTKLKNLIEKQKKEREERFVIPLSGGRARQNEQLAKRKEKEKKDTPSLKLKRNKNKGRGM